MLFGWKRSKAAVERASRRAIAVRGWRSYTSIAIVAALAVAGTAAAASALPARAASHTSAQSLRFRPTGHNVWLRHEGLSGLMPQAAHTKLRNTLRNDFSPSLPGFRQGQVAVPGASIHYVIGGSGPVLVLLHGWPETWWEWHLVMPSLAHTHTVIAFDLPGIGNSTAPHGDDFSEQSTAKILHEAVRALGFQDISILGHDGGAPIAYAYATLYPQQVTKMAVLESPLAGFGLESIEGFSFHFLLNVQPPPTPEGIVNNFPSEVTYLNYMFNSFALNPSAITSFDRAVYYAAYASPVKREAGYDYYRAINTLDAAYDLQAAATPLTMPIQAMGGDHSLGALVAQSFQQVATDVHAVVAPNAGHYIAEEVPAFLAECENLFFSSATTAPAGFGDCLSS
jgi:pimeloyl-ACP methyl ester carboxylesterase